MATDQIIPIPGFKAIAAVSLNGCIGKDGKLPWHLPEDLHWFKVTTKDSTLVMGRATWESIGSRRLPDRGLLVVSSQELKVGCCRCDIRPEALLAHVRKIAGAYRTVWLCGGAQTYKEFLPWCEELYVTLVRQVVDGDTFFPSVSAREFQVVEVLQETPEFQIVRMRNAALFQDGIRD